MQGGRRGKSIETIGHIFCHAILRILLICLLWRGSSATSNNPTPAPTSSPTAAPTDPPALNCSFDSRLYADPPVYSIFTGVDDSYRSVPLPSPLFFFGTAQTTLFISSNGIVTFGSGSSSYTSSPFPLFTGSIPIIAPFWSDIDLRGIVGSNGNQIRYGLINYNTFPEAMQRINCDIRVAGFVSNLTVTNAFIATWDRVARFAGGLSLLNTFQLIIAWSNQQHTFVFFKYPVGGIQWQSFTQVGFDKGDGINYYQIPGSRTIQMQNLPSLSNVHIPGFFAFYVSSLQIQNPPPTIISVPNDYTVSCDLSGTRAFNASTIQSGTVVAQPNGCSGVVVTYSDMILNSACPIEIRRTFTVQDTCGAVSPLHPTQALRIAIPQTPPEFSYIPPNLVLLCNTTFTGMLAVAGSALAGPDNLCSFGAVSPPSVTQSYSTSAYSCSLQRIWTVRDACGYSRSVVQLITTPETSMATRISAEAPPSQLLSGDCNDASIIPTPENGGGFPRVTNYGTCPVYQPYYNDLSYPSSQACPRTVRRYWTINSMCATVSTVQEFYISGSVDNVVPSNGAVGVLITANIRLQWSQPVPGVSAHDIYFWESGNPKPSQPSFPNVAGLSVTLPLTQSSPSILSGRTYLWQVIYKLPSGEQFEGPFTSFETEKIPNLIVEEIFLPSSAFTGTTVVLTARIRNIGTSSSPFASTYHYLRRGNSPLINNFVSVVASTITYFPIAAGDYIDVPLSTTLPIDQTGLQYFRWDILPFFRVESSAGQNLVSSALEVQLTPPPDLRPLSVVIDTLSFSGNEITLRLTTENIGSGPTRYTNSFLNSVWMQAGDPSTTTSLTKSAATLLQTFTQTLQPSLLPAAQVTVVRTVKIPNAISGTFTIFVEVNSGSPPALFENGQSNNNILASSSALEVILSPWPDFTVNSLQVTSSIVNAGASVCGSIVFKNKGAGSPFESQWLNTLTVTRLDMPSQQTVLFNQYQYAPFDPNQEYVREFCFSAPERYNGKLLIEATANSNRLAFENGMYNNNNKSIIVDVRLTFPNLQVHLGAIEIDQALRTISVNYNIVNAGNATFYAIFCRNIMTVSTSSGNMFSGELLRKNSDVTLNLLPGQEQTRSISAYLDPLMQANAYVYVQVNAWAPELELGFISDNTDRSNSALSLNFLPSSISATLDRLSDFHAFAGTYVNMFVNITNYGPGAEFRYAASRVDTLYIVTSTTSTSPMTPPRIVSFQNVLQPGASTQFEIGMQMPLETSAQIQDIFVVYELGRVDSEAFTTVPHRAFVSFQLLRPPYSSLVIVGSPTIRQKDPTVAELEASWVERNDGADCPQGYNRIVTLIQQQPPFRQVRLREMFQSVPLLKNQEIETRIFTPLPTSIASISGLYRVSVTLNPAFSVDPPAPVTSTSQPIVISFPPPQDTRVITSLLSEFDSAPNPQQQTYSSGAPCDIFIETLQLLNTSARAGEALPVNMTIRNSATAGLSGSSFRVRVSAFYSSLSPSMSLNQILSGQLSPSDVWEISTMTVTRALEPDRSRVLSQGFLIPVRFPAGSYTLLAVADVDNQLADSNRTNNIAVMTNSPFQVLQPELPDFAISLADDCPGRPNLTAQQGQELFAGSTFSCSVKIEVNEIGTAVQSPFLISIGLGISTTQQQILRAQVASSALIASTLLSNPPNLTVANGSYVHTFKNILVPSYLQTSGDLFLVALVNQRLSTLESRTDNNVAVNAVRINLPPIVDIAVTDVVAPTNASAGDSVTVAFTIQNPSTVALPGLRVCNRLSFGFTYLQTECPSIYLSSGQSKRMQFSTAITPDVIVSNLTAKAMVEVNSARTFGEMTYDNNTAAAKNATQFNVVSVNMDETVSVQLSINSAIVVLLNVEEANPFRLVLKVNDEAAQVIMTEIFVGFDKAPTRSVSEASSGIGQSADQYVLYARPAPRTPAFATIYTLPNPLVPSLPMLNLTATVALQRESFRLNRVIRNSKGAVGGPFSVALDGIGFMANMFVQLMSAAGVVPAVRIPASKLHFIDSSSVYVTFEVSSAVSDHNITTTSSMWDIGAVDSDTQEHLQNCIANLSLRQFPLDESCEYSILSAAIAVAPPSPRLLPVFSMETPSTSRPLNGAPLPIFVRIANPSAYDIATPILFAVAECFGRSSTFSSVTVREQCQGSWSFSNRGDALQYGNTMTISAGVTDRQLGISGTLMPFEERAFAIYFFPRADLMEIANIVQIQFTLYMESALSTPTAQLIKDFDPSTGVFVDADVTDSQLFLNVNNSDGNVIPTSQILELPVSSGSSTLPQQRQFASFLTEFASTFLAKLATISTAASISTEDSSSSNNKALLNAGKLFRVGLFGEVLGNYANLVLTSRLESIIGTAYDSGLSFARVFPSQLHSLNSNNKGPFGIGWRPSFHQELRNVTKDNITDATGESVAFQATDELLVVLFVSRQSADQFSLLQNALSYSAELLFLQTELGINASDWGTSCQVYSTSPNGSPADFLLLCSTTAVWVRQIFNPRIVIFNGVGGHFSKWRASGWHIATNFGSGLVCDGALANQSSAYDNETFALQSINIRGEQNLYEFTHNTQGLITKFRDLLYGRTVDFTYELLLDDGSESASSSSAGSVQFILRSARSVDDITPNDAQMIDYTYNSLGQLLTEGKPFRTNDRKYIQYGYNDQQKFTSKQTCTKSTGCSAAVETTTLASSLREEMRIADGSLVLTTEKGLDGEINRVVDGDGRFSALRYQTLKNGLRVLTGLNVGGAQYSFQYDETGSQLTALTEPDGSRWTFMQENSASRVIYDPNGVRFISFETSYTDSDDSNNMNKKKTIRLADDSIYTVQMNAVQGTTVETLPCSNSIVTQWSSTSVEPVPLAKYLPTENRTIVYEYSGTRLSKINDSRLGLVEVQWDPLSQPSSISFADISQVLYVNSNSTSGIPLEILTSNISCSNQTDPVFLLRFDCKDAINCEIFTRTPTGHNSSQRVIQTTLNNVTRTIKTMKGNGAFSIEHFNPVTGVVGEIENFASNGTRLSFERAFYDRSTGLTTRIQYDSGTIRMTANAKQWMTSATDLDNTDYAFQYTYDSHGNRRTSSENGISLQYVSNSRDQYIAVDDAHLSYHCSGNLETMTPLPMLDRNFSLRCTFSTFGALEEYSDPYTGNNYTFHLTPLRDFYKLVSKESAEELRVTWETFHGQFGSIPLVLEFWKDNVRLWRIKLVFSPTFGIQARVLEDGTVEYFDFDLRGNVVGIISDKNAGQYVAKYRYSPFGAVIFADEKGLTVPNHFKFLGRFGALTLTKGLVHIHSRVYDPYLGRFLSIDPAWIINGQLNPFTYAQNNPFNYIDGDGRNPLVLAAAASAAVSCVSGAAMTLVTTEAKNFGELMKATGISCVSGAIDGAVSQVIASRKALQVAYSVGKNLYGEFSDPNKPPPSLNVDTLQRASKAVGLGVVSVFLPDSPLGGIMSTKKSFFDRVVEDMTTSAVNDNFLNSLGNDFDYLMNVVISPSARKSADKSLADVEMKLKCMFGGCTKLKPRKVQSSTTVGRSVDPNEIIGPGGYGPSQFISTNAVQFFTVNFENAEKLGATQPAVTVNVTLAIDQCLDVSTFKLLEFGFGNQSFHVPVQLARLYQQNLMLPDYPPAPVVRVVSGIVSGDFLFFVEAYNAETGERQTQSQKGVLPVNRENSTEGQGFVRYSVQALDSCSSGSVVSTQAFIQFDKNEIIFTNIHKNTLDKKPPNSTLNVTAANQLQTELRFEVTFDDDISGPAFYNLLASDRSGTQSVVVKALITERVFQMELPANMSSMCFTTQGFDNTGNVEVINSFESWSCVEDPSTLCAAVNNCTNHGVCVARDQCLCHDGYAEINCSVYRPSAETPFLQDIAPVHCVEDVLCRVPVLARALPAGPSAVVEDRINVTAQVISTTSFGLSTGFGVEYEFGSGNDLSNATVLNGSIVLLPPADAKFQGRVRVEIISTNSISRLMAVASYEANLTVVPVLDNLTASFAPLLRRRVPSGGTLSVNISMMLPGLQLSDVVIDIYPSLPSLQFNITSERILGEESIVGRGHNCFQFMPTRAAAIIEEVHVKLGQPSSSPNWPREFNWSVRLNASTFESNGEHMTVYDSINFTEVSQVPPKIMAVSLFNATLSITGYFFTVSPEKRAVLNVGPQGRWNWTNVAEFANNTLHVVLNADQFPPDDTDYLMYITTVDEFQTTLQSNVTNVHIDLRTEPIVITQPAAQSETSTVNISLQIPEQPLDGLVSLRIQREGDLNYFSGRIENVTQKGSHSIQFSATNLHDYTSAHTFAWTSGSLQALQHNDVINIYATYSDSLGNPPNTSIVLHVTLDLRTERPDIVAPVNGTSHQYYLEVQCRLPEAFLPDSTYLTVSPCCSGQSRSVQMQLQSTSTPNVYRGDVSLASETDQTYVWLACSYKDAFANPANVSAAIAIFLDNATLTPSLSSPASGSTVSRRWNITFILPEQASWIQVAVENENNPTDTMSSSIPMGNVIHQNPAQGLSRVEINSLNTFPSPLQHEGRYAVKICYRDQLNNAPACSNNIVVVILDTMTTPGVLSADSLIVPEVFTVHLDIPETPHSVEVRFVDKTTLELTVYPVNSIIAAGSSTTTFNGSILGFVYNHKYEVSFAYQDRWNNPPANSNMLELTYDTVAELGSWIEPSGGSVARSFTLRSSIPEQPSPHTVVITIVGDNLTASFEANLSANSQGIIAQVRINDGILLGMQHNGVYAARISYTDLVGNTAAWVSADFQFDSYTEQPSINLQQGGVVIGSQLTSSSPIRLHIAPPQESVASIEVTIQSESVPIETRTLVLLDSETQRANADKSVVVSMYPTGNTWCEGCAEDSRVLLRHGVSYKLSATVVDNIGNPPNSSVPLSVKFDELTDAIAVNVINRVSGSGIHVFEIRVQIPEAPFGNQINLTLACKIGNCLDNNNNNNNNNNGSFVAQLNSTTELHCGTTVIGTQLMTVYLNATDGHLFGTEIGGCSLSHNMVMVANSEYALRWTYSDILNNGPATSEMFVTYDPTARPEVVNVTLQQRRQIVVTPTSPILSVTVGEVVHVRLTYSTSVQLQQPPFDGKVSIYLIGFQNERSLLLQASNVNITGINREDVLLSLPRVAFDFPESSYQIVIEAGLVRGTSLGAYDSKPYDPILIQTESSYPVKDMESPDVTVIVFMKLSLDYQTVISKEADTILQYKTDLTNALHIPMTRIEHQSFKIGSVVAEFKILPAESRTNQRSPIALYRALQELIDLGPSSNNTLYQGIITRAALSVDYQEEIPNDDGKTSDVVPIAVGVSVSAVVVVVAVIAFIIWQRNKKAKTKEGKESQSGSAVELASTAQHLDKRSTSAFSVEVQDAADDGEEDVTA